MNQTSKIFFLCFILILVKSVFPQIKDSTEMQKTDFLNKGKFAVVFELGTLISRGSFFEGYNFLAKYHIGDKSALRVNFKIGEGMQSNPGSVSSTTQEYSSYDYEVNANFLYYLSKKTFIKPFISIGPTFSFNYYYELYENESFQWYREWSMGATFTLGAEVFLYNNVSLIGEYLIKGEYRKYDRQYWTKGRYQIYYKDIYRKFSANTARLGFSIYF
jgi:hypothetical protein